ncbi:MAG TPA: WD40 repeat domain-containing protein [Gemmataceae bacterium]|nr:WD40 repeat domain-containing protein [Gemmataceae bacterium]
MATPNLDFKQTRVALELKHTSPLIGCRFDPTGRYLFVSAQDSTVQRYDLLTGKNTPLSGHASWVRGIAFSPPAARAIAPSLIPPATVLGALAAVAVPPSSSFKVITGDYHGKLIWWDGAAETPTPIRTVEAHEGWVRAVAVSPDGDTVASCGNDHLVKLWSVADGKPVRSLTGHECHVYNVAFHPAGGRLVSCDLKGVVKDWDLTTGKLVRELDAKVLHKYDTGFRADIGGARGMSFSPDGSTLACTGITNVSNAFAGVGNPLVLLFDWKDGKARQLKTKEAFQGTGWGVAIHPAGFTVAAGGASNGRIWYWEKDENVHTVTVPASARDMALHASGTALAVAGHTGVATVYTLVAGPPAAKGAAPAKK